MANPQQHFPQYHDPFIGKDGHINRSWRNLLQSLWERTGSAVNITGIMKGDGLGNTTAATAGTDYLLPSGSGASLTNLNASALASGTVAAVRGGAGAINGLLKANGSGVVSQAAANTDYLTPIGSMTLQYSVPTVGSTVTVTLGGPHHSVLMAPAAGLATLTIALPGSPTAGQIVVLSSTQVVTALTISGGTTAQAITALSANVAFRLQYESSSTKWYSV